MCGRFVSTTTPQQLAAYFSVDELAVEQVSPNYNVAPTQSVLVVTENEEHHRVLDAYHWGLIPPWAKEAKIGNRMINARAETVAEKPSFKKAFTQRRCLIPADGFYEWKKAKDGKTKQPYFIHPTDEPVFAFAGLWERWRDPQTEEWMRSCAIIVGEANSVVGPIHDRMPVVVPRDAWDGWLDPENGDVDALKELLVPAPAKGVAAYPVRHQVNSPRNNVPENLDADPDPSV